MKQESLEHSKHKAANNSALQVEQLVRKATAEMYSARMNSFNTWKLGNTNDSFHGAGGAFGDWEFSRQAVSLLAT